MLLHCTRQPDLGLLPEDERRAVARALSKNPQDRFATCADFIRAVRLGRDSVEPIKTVRRGCRSGHAQQPAPDQTSLPGTILLPQPRHFRLLSDMLADVGGAVPAPTPFDAENPLAGQFVTPLPRDLLRRQLERFLETWKARQLSGSGGRF